MATPFQYSCLKHPTHSGSWRATEVTKSRTRLGTTPKAIYMPPTQARIPIWGKTRPKDAALWARWESRREAPASVACSSARVQGPLYPLHPSRGVAVDYKRQAVLVNTVGPESPWGLGHHAESRGLPLAAIEETALKLDGGGAGAPAEPTEEP